MQTTKPVLWTRRFFGWLRSHWAYRRLGRKLFAWQIKLRVVSEPIFGREESGCSEPLAGRERSLVAEWLGQEVGRARLQYISGPESVDVGWWLYDLYVHFLFRSLGIGERLLLDQIAWAQANGVSELKLFAFEDNMLGLEFYLALGFRRALLPPMEERLEREAAAGMRRRIVLHRGLRGCDVGAETS